jgi:D-ribose pyranase
MKKAGLLNAQALRVIGSMGHTDLLVVCDAGFPCPLNVERVDLAVTSNLPTLPQVLEVILGELCVEAVFAASETRSAAPARLAELETMFAPLSIATMPHTELKQLAASARAIIRTGDFTPYSNVIVRSGVPYA